MPGQSLRERSSRASTFWSRHTGSSRRDRPRSDGGCIAARSRALSRPWPDLMPVVDHEGMCVAALGIQGRRRNVRVAGSKVGMGVSISAGIGGGPERRRCEEPRRREPGQARNVAVEPAAAPSQPGERIGDAASRHATGRTARRTAPDGPRHARSAAAAGRSGSGRANSRGRARTRAAAAQAEAAGPQRRRPTAARGQQRRRRTASPSGRGTDRADAAAAAPPPSSRRRTPPARARHRAPPRPSAPAPAPRC